MCSIGVRSHFDAHPEAILIGAAVRLADESGHAVLVRVAVAVAQAAALDVAAAAFIDAVGADDAGTLVRLCTQS